MALGLIQQRLPAPALDLVCSGMMVEKNAKDLAEEQFQKVMDQWNEDRMKRLYFINKRLREKNKARTFINNVDEEMLEYY